MAITRIPFPDGWLTIEQAAAFMGVTRKTIDRWTADGKIKHEIFARRKAYNAEALAAFKADYFSGDTLPGAL